MDFSYMIDNPPTDREHKLYGSHITITDAGNVSVGDLVESVFNCIERQVRMCDVVQGFRSEVKNAVPSRHYGPACKTIFIPVEGARLWMMGVAANPDALKNYFGVHTEGEADLRLTMLCAIERYSWAELIAEMKKTVTESTQELGRALAIAVARVESNKQRMEKWSAPPVPQVGDMRERLKRDVDEMLQKQEDSLMAENEKRRKRIRTFVEKITAGPQ
jgi:hypothetical protein